MKDAYFHVPDILELCKIAGEKQTTSWEFFKFMAFEDFCGSCCCLDIQS